MRTSNKDDLDISKDIYNICAPLVSSPELLKVTKISEEKKQQKYLIQSSEKDVGKLIGRNGLISNSIRTLVNISLHSGKKHAVLKFEAID